MTELRLQLQENNLAEVLAGVGVLGILHEAHPECPLTSHWERNLLVIDCPVSETEAVAEVLSFLKSLRWVQALGNSHQGMVTCKSITGIDPLLDPALNAEPSIFKNFSGQVTGEKILEEQVALVASVSADDFTTLLSASGVDVGSWGLDWRTNGHSLDIGFSANDDGTSKFDPVYIATELLALCAQSFFLPAWALNDSSENIAYAPWTESLPISLTQHSLLGMLPGSSGLAYRLARRGKSYGKGASYKYFPPAVLTNS
jgi:hypothetical protein